jgi:WD40 repeat protein/serine/threonine protein kinase
MNATPERVKSVFLDAVQNCPPDRWDRYLGEACGADEQLHRRVKHLLEAHQKADSFLAEPDHVVTVTATSCSAEFIGEVIGPYKLLEPIGEGGMGTVFLAEQARPVRRKVALKIIKPGMDTKQVIARFEAERQALALMDHPNIAKVHDAGTADSGRPYFVMELVNGVPITRYCDEKRLTPRERLELFIPVCQAIQHAHQKGIIHRDLKPSNVLVGLYDGKPVPKVIDFGVAKAAGPKLTEATLFTGFGMVIGTPEYMSPEQAQLDNVDIDTRSDIYSLGVLLYELLTGSTPFAKKDLEKAGLLETLRMIREQEPPTPSTKLSTAEGLPTLAANRSTEPAKLAKLVRGELDWIVMKALEKDRNRRYETAGAFAADVQGYLKDESVHACPPSAGYRLRKFARRNKRMAVTASFVFALMVLAVAALAAGYAQVSKALKRERQTTYLRSIALAERELAASNVGQAEMLLDACPDDLRGWEWHFLKRQRYERFPPIKHHDSVIRAAFSPDCRQLTSVCMDGTLEIRDSQTGRVLHTLQRQAPTLGGGNIARGMAYSPDSRYLALARHDGIIRIWDATSGQLLPPLLGHKGTAWHVAFSPDSRTLASGGSDRSVRLWDVASGKSLRVFSAHPAPVKGVAFRPDDQSVLAACEDGTVKGWDPKTGRQTSSFRGELLTGPDMAFFSPDARRLAWAWMDGLIKIWDTTTGRLEIDQQSDNYRCRAVSFSPDGKRIALAGMDGTVRLLDAVTGREMLTIFAHPSLVADVTFDSKSNRLASAGFDTTVRIWDATELPDDPQASCCVTLSAHEAPVSGVAFSLDGRWLASSSWDGTVKVWELLGKSEPGAPGPIALRFTLRGHRENVEGVAFCSDNRTLASAGWDKTVKLWNLQAPLGDSLAELRTIPCTHRVFGIVFSPDGRLLAVGQQDGIGLYDPASGKSAAPFKRTPAPVPGLVFSPDSRHLISAGASDPAVKIWDVAAENFSFEIRQIGNGQPSVAVSPDGRRIAAPFRDNAAGRYTAKVWDVNWDAKTYAVFRTLDGHAARIFKVAFSPDGRYLATGSWDSTIKVWDLEAPTSAEPVTLRGHAGFILGLAYSPDGRRLASASGHTGHGEVKVWDATLWEDKSSGGR